MIDQLKRYALRKQIDKNLIRRDLSNRNNRLKKLGFLIDETVFDTVEALMSFGEELQLHPKDVRVFGFSSVEKTTAALQDQITNKEFGWFGQLQNQSALEFLNIPFDVLVGFYRGDNIYLDAMAAQSSAGFKIGFSGADQRLYDLILSTDPDDFETAKSEIIKYLRILNKI